MAKTQEEKEKILINQLEKYNEEYRCLTVIPAELINVDFEFTDKQLMSEDIDYLFKRMAVKVLDCMCFISYNKPLFKKDITQTIETVKGIQRLFSNLIPYTFEPILMSSYLVNNFEPTNELCQCIDLIKTFTPRDISNYWYKMFKQRNVLVFSSSLNEEDGEFYINEIYIPNTGIIINL